ncbi:MAG: DMT family transporter [Gammaproteobacteria bacterium]
MSTRRFYLSGFVALMLFDTLTQVFFKLATQHAGAFAPDRTWLIGVVHNGWIVGAMLGYVLAFITWMTLLKHAPVGPAFAASHSEVVTILAVSVVYFHERLTWIQVLGGLCIVLGIVCLSFGQPAPRTAELEPD